MVQCDLNIAHKSEIHKEFVSRDSISCASADLDSTDFAHNRRFQPSYDINFLV